VNIGEEQEPIEMPIPLAPGQKPMHEPSPAVAPVTEPAKEPAHARAGVPLTREEYDGIQLAEELGLLGQEVRVRVSMSERNTDARCDRG
jgi:hypothetical protein